MPVESRHQYLTNNHRLERFVFADATARAAGSGQVDGLGDPYTIGVADVGQIAFQQSDSSYWRLTGVGPLAWHQIAGSGSDPGALQSANNLSDVASASTARTNLGLGTAATHAATDFQAAGTYLSSPIAESDVTGLATDLAAKLVKASNLSDLASAPAARTNLGLGTLATQSGTFSGTSSGTNTGDQTITLTGDVTGSGTGSFAATLAASGVTAAAYGDASHVPVVTFDAKGRATAVTNTAIALAASAITSGTISNARIASRNDAGNSGTALTVDWSVANAQKVTLTGNVTFTFTSPTAGGVYVLELAQDATGSRTVTWPASVKWAGGTAPTLTTTASKTDVITLFYNGTNFLGVTSGLNY